MYVRREGEQMRTKGAPTLLGRVCVDPAEKSTTALKQQSVLPD
jgi:hypothetical protein